MVLKFKKNADWISEVSSRFRSMQIKAATKVNSEMLRFYWSLGRDISAMQAENRYGSDFWKNLSADLEEALPQQKSFSPSNLRYMKRFYELYMAILPQLVEELEAASNVPQVVDDLFSIPWGHHRYIIDKCSGDVQKALFYVRKTAENSWSRAVLLNWLDTNLYERQGKAITNFSAALPAPQGDLAQEITKDPYNFDFLAITANYNEKEFKDALQDNIIKFLMEMGSGFAFVGREYRLVICKEKDNVLAQYALESSSEPIGISEYELSKLYPADFKGSLPTIEEIEQQLK